jgi:hypothetical protein
MNDRIFNLNMELFTLVGEINNLTQTKKILDGDNNTYSIHVRNRHESSFINTLYPSSYENLVRMETDDKLKKAQDRYKVIILELAEELKSDASTY